VSRALNLSDFCQFEENVDLQLHAARSVAAFAAFSAAPGAPRSTATDKIIKNLGTFLCQDKDYAPIFEEWRSEMEGIPIARQNQILATAKSGARSKAPEDVHISPEDQKSRLIRRGAQAALSEIAAEFGEKLFNTLPILWEIMAQPLMNAYRVFSPYMNRDMNMLIKFPSSVV
jgi:TATA-binding protein-associated factor